MNDIIFAAINLGIAEAFFVLGKYVFPKIPKTITDKLFELGQMAEKFVVWAREFMKSSTGAEKMEKVVEMLKEVAEEAGLKVTDEQLQAIVQAAYEAMKAGEKEAQQAAPAASVVINTQAPAGTVAIPTNDVPEDALEDNADGTVNAYDEQGKKVGTIAKEVAEQAAANVTVILQEGEVVK